MNHAWLLCVVLVLAGCAWENAVRVDEGGASRKRNALVPHVEHHTHLVGPTAVEPEPAPLPPVTLPPDLAAVLAERERLSGVSTPSELFTEDAQILDVVSGEDRWERGREAAARLTRAYPVGTKWTPTAFGVDGNTAWIAGGSRPAELQTDDMHFTLGLKKVEGRWRIAAEQATNKPPRMFGAPITADFLIERLDEAGIEKGVVLSVAYWFGSPRRSGPGEYDRVRAENDWAIAEVGKYPQRLVVFCSMNPLKDYALPELERCSKLPGVKGVKVHMGNSRVDFKNAQHVEALRKFFRAANELRMAIVAHLWNGPTYNAEDAKVVLEKLLPEAPDVTVQIAHMGAAGGYAHDDAIEVLANAAEAKDPRMKNVYFDLTTVVTDQQPEETVKLLARRIRQIGVDKILYGTDTIVPSRPAPVQSWATTRRRLPLTDEELRVIADNVAPYLR